MQEVTAMNQDITPLLMRQKQPWRHKNIASDQPRHYINLQCIVHKTASNFD